MPTGSARKLAYRFTRLGRTIVNVGMLQTKDAIDSEHAYEIPAKFATVFRVPLHADETAQELGRFMVDKLSGIVPTTWHYDDFTADAEMRAGGAGEPVKRNHVGAALKALIAEHNAKPSREMIYTDLQLAAKAEAALLSGQELSREQRALYETILGLRETAPPLYFAPQDEKLPVDHKCESMVLPDNGKACYRTLPKE